LANIAMRAEGRVVLERMRYGYDRPGRVVTVRGAEDEIKQVMHSETGRTVNEYLHEIDPAEFMPAWLKTHQGKDLDKTTGKGAGAGSSGSGRPGSDDDGAPKKKLFGKK